MTLTTRLIPDIPIRPPSERADIVIAGLEHGGPSYEVRIFLNRPDADARTEATADTGYAGSIYVYGAGQPRQTATAGSMRPTRYVTATDAVRAAAAKGSTMSLTLVPVTFDPPDIDIGPVRVEVRIDEAAPEVG